MKRSSAKDGHGGRARTAKARLRRKLASEARSVDRRLKAAVVPNFSGPVLGTSQHRLRAGRALERHHPRRDGHGRQAGGQAGLGRGGRLLAPPARPAQALSRVRPRVEHRL